MKQARRDLARQIGVLSAACFMIIAAMIGTGALGGTPVQELQDGALDVDGSYLAPARPAFSIWSVIYLGLIVYTVWQALPGQRADVRQRALGWWIAATMVLNGLWLVTSQFLTLPLTVVMIVVLLVVLAVTFRRAVVVAPPEGWTDRVLIDGVTGLHLGWVTLATVANTAAWLTRTVPPAWEDAATMWGIAVLAAVAAIGAATAGVSGRLAPALATSWGLAWLAVARVTGEPHNDAIGWTALVVAVIVLIAGIGVTAARARPNRTAARTSAADATAR
ncbi:tryptophan-rich sensory protein [Microbacterium hominis]|uniref:Tryptophan-rich sensory protein n=1 Tax=Microbacterium hominis TaxID=162426 RepID=A0A7D4U6I8_9MICO|nr:tryptophan-rich sensory protein [Microbacterium hominis]QKJ18406.1 tryptophan-rich sensory protein [Microbacterium hominis]